MYSCGTDTGTTTKESENADVENSQLTSEWEYRESEDKMGDVSKFAEIKSDDVLEFDFPYDGGSESFITIRKKRDVTDLMYRVTKGQINAASSIDGGRIRVKFDNEKPFETRVTGPSDYSTETIFFQNPKKIINKMKSAKKMVLEVEFFNEGNRQIEFNVDGLKWE